MCSFCRGQEPTCIRMHPTGHIDRHTPHNNQKLSTSILIYSCTVPDLLALDLFTSIIRML